MCLEQLLENSLYYLLVRGQEGNSCSLSSLFAKVQEMLGKAIQKHGVALGVRCCIAVWSTEHCIGSGWIPRHILEL